MTASASGPSAPVARALLSRTAARSRCAGNDGRRLDAPSAAMASPSAADRLPPPPRAPPFVEDGADVRVAEIDTDRPAPRPAPVVPLEIPIDAFERDLQRN